MDTKRVAAIVDDMDGIALFEEQKRCQETREQLSEALLARDRAEHQRDVLLNRMEMISRCKIDAVAVDIATRGL